MSKNEMVSAPKLTPEGIVKSIRALLDLDARGSLAPHGIGGLARDLFTKCAEVLSRPADQHQGEPVALPERESVSGRLPGHEAIGWNACIDEIAKLGPLYAHADPGEVERLRTENERLLAGFYQQVTDADLKEIADFISDGDLPTKSFFMRPDAANLANVTMHMVREVQAARAKLAERDALFARILGKRDACAASFWFDEIQALLSASAEPSEGGAA